MINMRLLMLVCFLCSVTDLTIAVRLASTREWYTIDLLQHISWDTPCTENAVEPIPAQDKQSTAFLLKGGTARCLEVEGEFVRGNLQTILTDIEELTVLAAFKQQHNNSGSILAFSSDNKILFEVESNGKREEMRVHYLHGDRTEIQVFPVHLADNEWHQVAITFTHHFIHVFIDCQQVSERQVDSIDLSFIKEDNVRLWVAQRNNRHAQLKGALEYVKIVTSPQGYLEQCPYADVACPTCNQFKSLENTVSKLYSFVQELHGKLELAEKRLDEVESCECLQSCEVDGTTYRDGESWDVDYCRKCTCRGGKVECTQPNCPVPNCKNPVLMDGHCCPTCLKHCFAGGTYYEHGEGFQPRDRICVDCTCGDGKMTCKHRTCPSLNCAPHDQIEITGECCKVCRNTDFCAAQTDCHPNATCVNLSTRHACMCDAGFKGDGKHCEDIDECGTKGGLDGHLCRGNSICTNTVGSYECMCEDGFVKQNPYSCKEYDACADTDVVCGEHAKCTNLRTSYKCECKGGYQGDGFDCKPICPEGCSNGGRCISPGVCQCRKGFIGTSCQEDIDECSLGMANCFPNSQCVNVPGSYTCDCKPGYHSNKDDNQNGWLCRDVDECAGFGGGHTCALGTECRNTEGGYECDCLDPRLCNLPCYIYYSNIAHGTIFPSQDDQCSTCKCNNGDVTCTRKSCDCNSPNVDLKCCDHCTNQQQCSHQELSKTYKNGETWMYHCQTCTCNNGHRECENIQCPKLDCSPAVQIEGDCCPRCMEETDACSVGDKDIIPTRTCLVDGRTYTYGQHFHPKRLDTCTTCTCKNGHICCSYNQTCMRSREQKSPSINHQKRSFEEVPPSVQQPSYVFDYNKDVPVVAFHAEETSNEDMDYHANRDSRSGRTRRRNKKRDYRIGSLPSYDASQTIRDTGQYGVGRNSGNQNDNSQHRQNTVYEREPSELSNPTPRHGKENTRRRERRSALLEQLKRRRET